MLRLSMSGWRHSVDGTDWLLCQVGVTVLMAQIGCFVRLASQC